MDEQPPRGDKRELKTIPNDPFELLGVNKNSSEEEVKSAYRKLASSYHPDKYPGDKEIENVAKALSEARDIVLSLVANQPIKNAKNLEYFRNYRPSEPLSREQFRGFSGSHNFNSDFNNIFRDLFGTSSFDILIKKSEEGQRRYEEENRKRAEEEQQRRAKHQAAAEKRRQEDREWRKKIRDEKRTGKTENKSAQGDNNPETRKVENISGLSEETQNEIAKRREIFIKRKEFEYLRKLDESPTELFEDEIKNLLALPKTAGTTEQLAKIERIVADLKQHAKTTATPETNGVQEEKAPIEANAEEKKKQAEAMLEEALAEARRIRDAQDKKQEEIRREKEELKALIEQLHQARTQLDGDTAPEIKQGTAEPENTPEKESEKIMAGIKKLEEDNSLLAPALKDKIAEIGALSLVKRMFAFKLKKARDELETQIQEKRNALMFSYAEYRKVRERERTEEKEEEGRKREEERIQALEADRVKNPFKYFVIDKMDKRIFSIIFGKEKEEITLEDFKKFGAFSKDLKIFGFQDFNLSDIRFPSRLTSWVTRFSLNGYSLQLQNFSEITDVFDPEARFRVVTPQGIEIAQDLQREEGEEFLEQEARKYQERMVEEFEKEQANNV